MFDSAMIDSIFAILVAIMLIVFVVAFTMAIMSLRKDNKWFKCYLKDTFELESLDSIEIKGYINERTAKDLVLKAKKKLETKKTEGEILRDIESYFSEGKKWSFQFKA